MGLAEKGKTLEIRLIVNSSCQDVFCRKCLALPDQNVELQVRNDSESDILLVSALDLLGPEGTLHIPNLFPHGEHRLRAGESMSLYTYLDEGTLRRFDTLVLRDSAGRSYEAPMAPRDPQPGHPAMPGRDARR